MELVEEDMSCELHAEGGKNLRPYARTCRSGVMDTEDMDFTSLISAVIR